MPAGDADAVPHAEGFRDEVHDVGLVVEAVRVEDDVGVRREELLVADHLDDDLRLVVALGHELDEFEHPARAQPPLPPQGAEFAVELLVPQYLAELPQVEQPRLQPHLMDAHVRVADRSLCV